MTSNDVDHIIHAINLAPDKLSRRQRDQLRTLAQYAPNLSYKQLKLLFRLLIIAGRYQPICSACGKPIKNVSEFSMDHIHPRAMGGGNALENLQPMHKICNETKGAKIQIQYTIKYSINTKIQVEITAMHEHTKCKKHRNVKRIKPSQINIRSNSGR